VNAAKTSITIATNAGSVATAINSNNSAAASKKKRRPQPESEKAETEHHNQREEGPKSQSCRQCGGPLVGVGMCLNCNRPGR
jgi:hypothetical protein